MDVYQIMTVHNRPWSAREMICFGIILITAVLVLRRLVRNRRIRISQAIASFLLLVFLGIVFGSTVFTRGTGVRQYKLLPFWSWGEVIFFHNWNLLQENLLNCILLFPMGVLLPLTVARPVKGRESFWAGAAVSVLIETCQLIFCRGLFEWDDMIHNGLGCMLGSVAACWVLEKMRIKK